MAIERNVKVVIAGENAKLEESIYVYQHDRGIDLTFDILQNKFSFTGQQSENIIRNNEIMYAGLTIKKPSGEGFFRPILPILENKVIFRIEHSYTNDFDEIGMYTLQIHLYDKFDNRISIPPFKLEVKPLIIDGINEIDGKTARADEAIVDVSVVGEDKELFIIEYTDGQGYVKTEWKAGEVITASRLNNLESGIENAFKALEELEIPSIEGLATEDFVNAQIALSKEELEALLESNKTELEDLVGTTKEDLEEKIESAKEELQQAIGNIEIPSIEGLASEEFVEEKVNSAKEDLEGQIQSVREEFEQTIGDIEIPSIEGLASEEFVGQAIAQATEPLASKEYVDEQIANIDIPEVDLSHLATKDEVQEAIDSIEIPSTDGLATEDYVNQTVNDATKGLASEAYVDHYVDKKIGDIEFPEPDLSNYYEKQETMSKEEILEALDNVSVDLSDYATKEELEQAIENIEIPDINGLATEEFVEGKVNGLATEDYVNEQIANIDFKETDLSNYYEKQETMSKEEILEALDNVSVDLSDYATLEHLRDMLRDYVTMEDIEEDFASKENLISEISRVMTNIQNNYYNKFQIDTKFEDVDNQISSINNTIREIGTDIEGLNTKVDEVVETTNAEVEATKALMQELRDYIDSIEFPDVDNLATKEELEDYTTKKELKNAIENAMKNTGLRVVGKLGAGLKMATELMPTKLKELKTPEHLIDTYGEVKHSYVYEAYPSSSGKQTWYKIIFFCDLDDPQNTGKYVSFNNGVFTFNGLEKGKDYAYATTTGTFGEDPFSVNSSLSTINHNDTRTYSYYMDFNLYSENGEEILVNNPQKAGISNLNEATSDGFYILDMDMSDYQELSNAPILEGSVAKGYLEVIGNTQKLSIVDGQSFIREIGGAWTRADNNAIRKNTIAIIGKSNQIKTPELFKTVPATLRAFHKEKERIVMFRATEDYYYVLKINSTYAYALSHNNTKFIVNGSYSPGLQAFWYSVSKGEWTNKLFYTTSTISNQEITINQNFFQVYHSDFDITNTVNNKWSISKGLVANYDVKETIKDFNNAVEAGYYDVNIEGISDGVANSPVEAIKGILKVERNDNVIYQELTSNNNKTVFKRVFDNNWSSWRYVGDEFVGMVGLTPKASIDKKGVFDNVPNPPTIRDSEYIGKYMYSYLSSSKHYYICTYLYKNTDTNKTPYLSTTEYTNNTGSYHYIQGYDYDSSTCRAFMKYEDDVEWSTSSSVQSMTDLQTAHIYHHDMPIYTGGRDKTGIYREAMNADIIGDLDSCKKAGKYYVNVKKDEYNQIGNIPLVKVEKDVETTLYVNVDGEKILQEITIEGVTYVRRLGESWTGLNNSFVKSDIVAHIKGIEPEATVDYEIETANVEDIYASCPVPNNHKTPFGTIDFKDSSGKYYRFIAFGKGSGFYLYQSGSSKTVGAYAYDQRYITRYTWDNGVWTEWTPTSTSTTYTYVSIGASGEILNSNLDVCKGTSNTAWDKTVIVRKADVISDIKTIYDFNEATTEGRYKVNVEENKEVLNTPEVGVLSGTLEVIKVDNIIKQVLTIKDNVFTRTFNEGWTEWFSSKAEEKAEEIGKVEISPRYEWDTVADKSIYNNLTVPNNCKSIWAGKLNNYSIVAFFNREIEMEVIKANNKEYMKVKDYKYSDVIGSYYYSSSKKWTSEGEGSCNQYYNGNTSSTYSLTATFYNNYVMYNEDGTIYKPSYLEKDVVLGIEDFNEAVELNTYTVKQEDIAIANSPIESEFTGVLEVVVTDNIITQKLTTAKDKFYTRVRDNEVWTNWNEWSSEGTSSEGGQSVDLSNYYTKSETYNKDEVDELIENIDIPDVNLDNYYTKGQVDELIDSIEIPEGSGESVDLSDYYTKNEIDTINKEYIHYNHNYTILLGSETTPIKLAKLNEMRPSSKHKAIGVYVNGVAHLAFYTDKLGTPMYFYSNSQHKLRVQAHNERSFVYKLNNGVWELQETPSNNVYDIVLPSAIKMSETFVAETGVNGSISNMYGCKFLFDKTDTDLGRICVDGRYRVENGNTSTFPEANGILDVITNLDFKRYTFYTTQKTYMKYEYADRANNGQYPGSWQEIGNNRYNINNYYTKKEVDSAIANATPEVDLSNYYDKAQTTSAISTALASYSTKTETTSAISTALTNYSTKTETDSAIDDALTGYSTTEQTVELINSLIGVPKTSLIEQTNRIIEMLKGEK